MLQCDRCSAASGTRWTSIPKTGLRGFRERWWITSQLESRGTVWRYIRLLERTPEPRLVAGELPEEARCVIYSPGHIGDVIQTGPLLRAIRKNQPRWSLSWVVGPWSAALARGLRLADDVQEYGPAWSNYHRGRSLGRKGWPEEQARLRQLGQRKADIFISTSGTNLDTLALGRSLQPSVWCGMDPDWPLYPVAPVQHLQRYQRDQYEAKFLLDLVRPIGIQGDDVALTMRWEDEEDRLAHELLQPLAGSRIVALAPGAGWRGKQWPINSFRELGRRLLTNGFVLLLVGSSQEADLVARVREGLNPERVLDISGRTSISGLAAVFSHCALLVCNDSGPMHLAAAVGTSTVSLFAATHSKKWAPRGERHIAIQSTADCSGSIPWHPSAPAARAQMAMAAISVDQVHDAAERLLSLGSV